MMPGLLFLGVILLISAFTLGWIVVGASKKAITRKQESSLEHAPTAAAVKSINRNMEHAQNESRSVEMRAKRLSELLDVRRGGRG